MFYYNADTKEYYPRNVATFKLKSTIIDPVGFLQDIDRENNTTLYYNESVNGWDLTYNWLGKTVYNKVTKQSVVIETVHFPLDLESDDYTRKKPESTFFSKWDEKSNSWVFDKDAFIRRYVKTFDMKASKFVGLKLTVKSAKVVESLKSAFLKSLNSLPLNEQTEKLADDVLQKCLNDLRSKLV